MSIISKAKRELIIEYWYRKLVNYFSSTLSFGDISSIILLFGEYYDQFLPSLAHKMLNINDARTEVSRLQTGGDSKSAFGSIIAEPGKKYDWSIKVLNTNAALILI